MLKKKFSGWSTFKGNVSKFDGNRFRILVYEMKNLSNESENLDE